MPLPAALSDLVKRFQDNRDSYTAHGYNETQLRREFLDPFFDSLGWDVANKQGYAEAYKEVIHEDAVKVGTATKAPDYSFRLGGGVRKFFVEAKKPSVSIKDDPSPAFQLRRYAWSANLPLSILSNFLEFAVYDCRQKPNKNDKASVGRILYITCDEYEKRWEEIASLFTKEAILKGSFDKFATGARRGKGTAEVDTAFLADIEEWRKVLAQSISRRNLSLNQRQINFAVQRTIDRLIFLRICEDRGIEDYGRLQANLNGERVYERLCTVFREADDRYNSGLFHFKDEKDRGESPDTVTLTLSIDDKILREIVGGLYYPESPYEFSVLPADILGQVYEQFLGKVIRLTAGHQAKVEDKPEVRKAGGVFYTPTYIVDYIVKNTVGKLLDGKAPKEAAKYRILDPACGSGSFLIGAYQFLLNWHRDWYLKNDPEKWARGKNPSLYKTGIGEFRLTTPERKRILLNNIYGVDIDTQAVEVTKLSLLLKVLEGETEQTIAQQLRLFHTRALPDLGNNIKCGNSLIGTDFYEGVQESLSLFEDEEEKYRINAFDWDGKDGFPEIMKTGGFDAVIGNPPYVIIVKDIFSDKVIDYLKRYPVSQYKTDLFHLFIQKGIDLLASNGLMGFITPNTWYTLQFTYKLREYVLKKSRIEEIVVFNHKVFESAEVDTGLLFLSNKAAASRHNLRLKKISADNSESSLNESISYQIPQNSWLENHDYCFEVRQTGNEGRLVHRIASSFPALQEVARASLGCQAYNSSKHTQQEIKDRVFHSLKKLSNDYLPELAGNDVGRYLIERKKGQWIKYGPWLHDYRTMDWLTGPRILIREISGKTPYKICACYVEETFCNYKTILNVNPLGSHSFSMKYLLGILNSKFLSFLYPFLANKIVTNSFPRLSVKDVKQLPIRSVDFSAEKDNYLHDKMVGLVTSMLDLNKKLASASDDQEKTLLARRIDATDRQIDKLVYELYGLTEEEIKIVEGGSDRA